MELSITVVMRNYLMALSAGNYKQMMSLFANDGKVHSPLYGAIRPSDFYTSLFEDTAQSVLTPIHFFENSDNHSGALYFKYHWIMENGNEVEFSCVDIFHFNPSYLITRLDIIYDTYHTRPKWDTMKVASRSKQ